MIDRSDRHDRPITRGPLQGIRVVDFSRILSGPFTTLLLSDMGAEVVKVERPGEGDETRGLPPFAGDVSHYFASVNRGKKSVALDLGSTGGRQLARELAASADVVVENFRPGVAQKLAIDFPSLQPLNPKLIYCSVSAFGQEGEWSRRPAYDLVVQAMSGMLAITGEEDGSPVKVGVPISDLSAGMFAAIRILGALFERETTGLGCYLDVSMFDASVSLMSYMGARYFLTGETPRRLGTSHPSVVPYGTFDALDGTMVVAVLGEQFWPRLCRAVDRVDLIDDPRFSTNALRLAHRDEIESLFRDIFSQCTLKQWADRLEHFDVPFGPIMNLDDVLESELMQRSGLRIDVDGWDGSSLGVVGTPITSRANGEAELQKVPRLGEHNQEFFG
jgi:crotonobetainyl-CoA:carnitine CoA-transferase CaiB-like acyl-CoA transferase